MKRIVTWASILYAAHIDGATIHVTGPDERHVEFGDGTTSFAALSGGEGYINSTVTVNAPDFVTMTGTSVNEMMSLIRAQQEAIASQQAELNAIRAACACTRSPPAPPFPPPLPPSPPPGQYIYVLGGYGCNNNPSNDVCRARNLERYDVQADYWQDLRHSIAFKDGTAMATIGSYIYAAGGCCTGYGRYPDPERRIERYNPSSNSWSYMAMAPSAMSLAYGVAHFGYFYTFTSATPVHVQRYYPETNSWAVTTTVPNDRTKVGVAALGHLLYVVGGVTSSGSCAAKTCMQSYDPGDGTPAGAIWTDLAPMQVGRLVPGVAAMNGFVYVNGGASGTGTTIVERYDPSVNEWATVAPNLGLRGEGTKMVLVGRFLYTFGTQASTACERYDPDDGVDGSWAPIASMRWPRSSYGVAVL